MIIIIFSNRVCHLAGKFAEHLNEAAKEDKLGIEITSEEILCIKVAGLCHDLGNVTL